MLPPSLKGAPMPRVLVLVSGLVQGVFYRATAVEVAHGLGLTGWVRNLPDGRVEAIAEGPAEALEAFVRWCHEGPAAARVDHVQAEPGEATGEFEDFQARR
jgi:acylphosphatase